MKTINLIAFLLLLFSCNKTSSDEQEEETEDLPVFSGTFKSTNKLTVPLPVMYIKNQKITDQGIIRPYLDRHALEFYFFLDVTEKAFAPSEGIELHFDGTNKFRYRAVGLVPRDTVSTIVSVDDGKLVLQLDSIDKVRLPITSSCYEKARLVEEIKNYSSCTMPNGGYQYCDYSLQFPLNRNGDNLELPYLSYSVTQGLSGTVICTFGTVSMWNNISATLVNDLKTGDTVVTQLNTMLFVKQ